MENQDDGPPRAGACPSAGLKQISRPHGTQARRLDDEAWGEIETAHPSYLGAQDTFYVGTMKGVGRIYQQTYIDTYAKTAQAKLYKR